MASCSKEAKVADVLSGQDGPTPRLNAYRGTQHLLVDLVTQKALPLNAASD
jgi:hypothetical protein